VSVAGFGLILVFLFVLIVCGCSIVMMLLSGRLSSAGRCSCLFLSSLVVMLVLLLFILCIGWLICRCVWLLCCLGMLVLSGILLCLCWMSLIR